MFKVTARDQGHYKGHSGAFVTYCNISCFQFKLKYAMRIQVKVMCKVSAKLADTLHMTCDPLSLGVFAYISLLIFVFAVHKNTIRYLFHIEQQYCRTNKEKFGNNILGKFFQFLIYAFNMFKVPYFLRL